MSIDEKFLALQDLPPTPVLPSGLPIVLFRQTGNLLFLSGHGPQWGSEFRHKGKLGKDLSVEEGVKAARLTTLNLLHTVRNAVSSLDAVCTIIEVVGMVNSAAGFTDQSLVLNGCSDCMVEIFGESGKHARTAVGMAELPFDICVEIKMVVEIKSENTK